MHQILHKPDFYPSRGTTKYLGVSTLTDDLLGIHSLNQNDRTSTEDIGLYSNYSTTLKPKGCN